MRNEKLEKAEALNKDIQAEFDRIKKLEDAKNIVIQRIEIKLKRLDSLSN